MERIPFFRGQRVLLDLYGTNQDRRTWKDPEEFEPERFSQWDASPFNFVPQGEEATTLIIAVPVNGSRSS